MTCISENETGTPQVITSPAKKYSKRKVPADSRTDTNSPSWQESIVDLIRNMQEQNVQLPRTAADHAAEIVRLQLNSVKDESKQAELITAVLAFINEERKKK